MHMFKQETMTARECALVHTFVGNVEPRVPKASRANAEFQMRTDCRLHPHPWDKHALKRARVVDIQLSRDCHRIKFGALLLVPGGIFSWIVAPVKREHGNFAAVSSLRK